MKIDKEAAVSRKTDETKTNIVASIEFAVRASLREEYVDADFVYSILGRVFAKSEDLGDKEDAGTDGICPGRVSACAFDSSAFTASLAVHCHLVWFLTSATQYCNSSGEPFPVARRLCWVDFRKLAILIRQAEFLVGASHDGPLMFSDNALPTFPSETPLGFTPESDLGYPNVIQVECRNNSCTTFTS